MSELSLSLNKESLSKLMQSFYDLTNIKIAVFDKNYNEILAYPNYDCAFCKLIKNNKETGCLCLKSDKKSFDYVTANKKLFIYRCHANLIEATAPLIDKDVVIGYIMFGQISDELDKKKLKENIVTYLNEHHIETNDENSVTKITRRSMSQIEAASRILEVCTFYVLFKNYISLDKDNFMTIMNNFIDSHLNENLSIERLTYTLNISKNKLYEEWNKNIDIGIAEYIKKRRIEKAKELLINTKKTITTISDDVGFQDYNYFCRVFKKEVGKPAKQYRKERK